MTQTPEEWLATPADPENMAEAVGDGIGITSPAAPITVSAGPNEQQIMAVIVRACTTCGEKRNVQNDAGDWVCASGHSAGDVIDLGIINAQYENPFKNAWWNLVGKRRARHRTLKANQRLP